MGDEGVRVRWWMVRGCGNGRVGVVSGGLDAGRARVCMGVSLWDEHVWAVGV